MNKKISILVTIICALLVVLGVVSIFLTDVGGVDFGNGHCVVISDEGTIDVEFDDYLKIVDTKIKELKLKVVEKQILKDSSKIRQGVAYSFLNSDQATIEQLVTELNGTGEPQYEEISIVATKFDNTAATRSIWYVAIGAGIALVLQFVFYVIFQQSTGRIASAVSTTIITLFAGAVTFGVVCLLALCGVKASIHSISAVVGVMAISIFAQAFVYARAGRIATLNKISGMEAFAQGLEYTKGFINTVFVVIQVTLLIFLIVGTYPALSFILPAFIGITCLMFLDKYLLPLLYNGLRKKQ